MPPWGPELGEENQWIWRGGCMLAHVPDSQVDRVIDAICAAGAEVLGPSSWMKGCVMTERNPIVIMAAGKGAA